MVAREIASKNILTVDCSIALDELTEKIKADYPDCLVVKKNSSIIGVVRERGLYHLMAGKASSLAEQLKHQLIILTKTSRLKSW